jgi:ATP-dependent RNA helicase DHX57
MKWMYEADPFAARQEVNNRQAKAARKHESTGTNTSGPATAEFSQVPEVKMATSLRELVEDAIKKVFSHVSNEFETLL